MFIYLVMAGWAAIGLAFNTRLSHMMAAALAPTGALFAFLSLWTGALWGKPTWGTYWVWDARLTSELSCCSSTSASWRCTRRSTTRGARTRPARCSRWSAW